jgi:hypothetical protein
VAVVGDHVVGTQPNGDINKVRWCAFRDHTAWTNGTDQAGEQPMLTGGSVQGICGGEYGIIFQRERIVRMDRTGDANAPFQFAEISVNYGCANGATIAQSGRTIFFYSDRGFMALDDGQVLKNIGSEKVDRTFGEEVSRDQLSAIYTAVDPQNKIVAWGIPGTPGKVWLYNFELDRWTTAELSFTGLFPGFTTSYALEDLPGLGYTNIDTMAISLDDPRWSGGEPRLYFVDETGALGPLTGDTLATSIELANVQLAQGRKARVRKVRPVWDGTANMTVAVNARQRLGDADAVTNAGTLRTSGIIPIRVSGKYLSTTIGVDAGEDWNYIQALEYEFDEGAAR